MVVLKPLRNGHNSAAQVSRSLFTYGSLMYADIFTAVAGQHCVGYSARLVGYRRSQVRGQRYPGIRPDADGAVTGVLYRGLCGDALARLDDFEGAEYCRETLTISTADGELELAECYVFRPQYYYRLLACDWDEKEFERVGKREFVRSFFADWQGRR